MPLCRSGGLVACSCRAHVQISAKAMLTFLSLITLMLRLQVYYAGQQ